MANAMQAQMLFDEAIAAGSRQELSDADEEYDSQKLMTHELYDSKQPQIIGRHLINSEVLAYESFEKILDNVSQILHEKYINSKLNGHILESTYDLVELLFSTEFIAYDQHPFVDSADAEPVLISYIRQ